MKVLFLVALAGLGSALDAACLADEFAADGYTTGQNIELDYTGTQISTASDGSTQLTVAFFVPMLYHENYGEGGFAISYNRDHSNTAGVGYSGDEAWKNKVTTTTNTVTGNDMACFTNRFVNGTCALGLNAGVWSSSANADNDCIQNYQSTVGWTDAITNEAYGEVTIIDDGDVTQVFLTATVETWRVFDETTTANYVGQMTGSEQINTDASPTDRTGTFFGDGGDLDVDFPALTMNDWRYTLYQIPFIMNFPKTVMVSTDFTVGSQITVLSGVVQQDTVDVNFNPDSDNTQATFAALDVTVTTQIQHPYAVRGPRDNDAPMTAVIGSTVDGGDEHARSIEFLEWDDESSCGNTNPGAVCSQNFKVRITPASRTPCSVAGDYTMEFWGECIQGSDLASQGGPNGCTLDVEATDSDVAVRRTSNGYFTLTFTVAHQSFCPEVMDTVHVAADFAAYHSEEFDAASAIDNTGGTNAVYSNDIIYYEVSYRTSSDKSTQSVSNNDPTGDGTDEIIDYVRAVKIFTDVTIGVSADGTASTGWDSSTGDFRDNLSWALGGSRVAGEDFDDQATTSEGNTVLTVTQDGATDRATYNIILCEVGYITADTPQPWHTKADDCFLSTAVTGLADDYFDFDKVMLSKGTNTIDENEIAFKMRLDERIIPVGPDTDNSHITLTVESEIYYRGNRSPTRRLLQADSQPARQQINVQSLTHPVRYRAATVTTCDIDTAADSATLDFSLEFGANAIPDVTSVNNWALNMKMQLEQHIGVQDSITVSKVETCNGQGCSVLINARRPVNRRRLQSSNSVHVTLDISSSTYNSAGQIANTLQTDIVGLRLRSSVDVFAQSTVSALSSPTCGSTAVHNTKLASSASALSTLLAFSIALFAML